MTSPAPKRLGAIRFEHAVRREITKRGGQKPSLRILRNLYQALSDPAGVLAHRPGALERVQLLLEDWAHTVHKLADTEQRMIAVLDQLELTELVTSITGISAVGAATILAETGDPNRFATARALVKHAGRAPRRSCRAPPPAGPSSPARADPGSGSRLGAQSGEPNAPTPSTQPGTVT